MILSPGVEEVKAAVSVGGRLLRTLKGDHIVEELIAILNEYVASHCSPV